MIFGANEVIEVGMEEGATGNAATDTFELGNPVGICDGAHFVHGENGGMTLLVGEEVGLVGVAGEFAK